MKVKAVKEFKPDKFIIVNSSFKITSADSGRNKCRTVVYIIFLTVIAKVFIHQGLKEEHY